MKIDCRDLDCPAPVLRVKEALESIEEGILDVELNTLSSIENVKRFVKSQGLYYEEKSLGARHIILSIVKGYECQVDTSNISEDSKKEAKGSIGYKASIYAKSSEALRAAQIAQSAIERQRARKLYSLLFGGIISAILASTCCLGPLLFLLFGVSVGSLSFLDSFAPYHDYFSLAAAVVLGYLWLDWFKERKDQIACASSLCKNYTLYLSLGTLFAALMLSYPYWAGYLFIED